MHQRSSTYNENKRPLLSHWNKRRTTIAGCLNSNSIFKIFLEHKRNINFISFLQTGVQFVDQILICDKIFHIPLIDQLQYDVKTFIKTFFITIWIRYNQWTLGKSSYSAVSSKSWSFFCLPEYMHFLIVIWYYICLQPF